VDKNYSPADSGEEKTRWEKVNKQLENASDVLQLVAPGQTGLIKSYVDAGYDIWVQSVAVMQVNSANQGQTQYLKAVTVLTQRMQVLVDLKKKNGLPPQAGD
jgi:phage terminase small subunit